jgi:hypothetical protein
MNTDTGELKNFDTNEALMEAMKNEPLVSVKESDMTSKQKKDMQVSKHDNKSKLGKKFTTARAKRKWVAKQIYKQNH